MWTLPRESKEYVGPITVKLGGVEVDTFEISVSVAGERPETWEDPVDYEGAPHRLTGPHDSDLPVGLHHVWARVTDDPQLPVIFAGSIHVT
ncbi:MAG: hypothetical protein ACRDXB_08210 [Actinomycetes bacterium]